MQGSVTGNKSVDKQQAGLKFVALVRQQLDSGSARDVLLDAHMFLAASYTDRRSGLFGRCS